MTERNLSSYFRPAPLSLRIGVEINRGAYGTVHEGELDDKPVAVKKIHRLLLEAASSERVAWATVIRNFERECRLLEALRHPYIVGFVGAFYEINLKEPILVMERMRENLRDLLGREKQLTLHRQLQICFEIVAGLEFLHSRSPPTVHRDLNDKNVMLSEEGVMKIGDLGQSRLKEESVDYFSTGQPGAIPFMPPEALRDKAHYNEKIDMFSLGVLMLEIATGRYPSVKLIGIGIESEITRRREDLSKLNEDHPLQHFVLQCLKDNYRDRPSATAVRSFLESQMVAAVTLENCEEYDQIMKGRGLQSSTPSPRTPSNENTYMKLSSLRLTPGSTSSPRPWNPDHYYGNYTPRNERDYYNEFELKVGKRPGGQTSQSPPVHDDSEDEHYSLVDEFRSNYGDRGSKFTPKYVSVKKSSTDLGLQGGLLQASIPSLSDRPSEIHLRHYVTDKIGKDWGRLATYLGLDYSCVEQIKQDLDNAEEQCFRVLIEWLRGKGEEPKTWEVLLNKLDRSGTKDISGEIREKIKNRTLNDF